MATFEQKVYVLRKEFAILDLNADSSLTKEEMLEAVDRRLGKQFDREIAEELWLKMDANHDAHLSVEEFIKVLIKAEDSLKGKITNLKSTLELNYRQKRETEARLEDLLKSEKLNGFGIMEGSQLSVTILEAVNLRLNSGGQVTDPYVVVKVDKFERQTKLSKTANPIFENELFYFPIQTGKEDIKFTVMDFDKYTSNVVVARVDVNIGNNSIGLRDQQIKDIWIDLYEPNGNLAGAQLHVQLQWVYSRVKYLREVLVSFNDQIAEQEQELLEYERDLAIIYEPFSEWRKLNQLGYVKDERPAQVHSIQPVTIKKTADQYQIVQPFTDPLIDNNEKFKQIKFLMPLVGFFTLLIMFERAQFLDLIILMDYYILWEWNALNENRVKSLGVLLAFSCKLDFAWIFAYGYNYLTETSLEGQYALALQRMVSILVVLALLLKMYCAYLFISLSKMILESLDPNSKQTKKQIIKIDVQSTNMRPNEPRTYLYQGKPILIQ